MKYQLINKDYESNDIVTQLFINRGFKTEDIPHYLNTTDEDILDSNLLKNIDEGAKMLLNHINSEKDLFIVPDVDADGFTSAAILINYIYTINPEYAKNHISYCINEGKHHGIVLENIPQDVSLVIYPDSASNDYEYHKILKDKGVNVLILDHHEAPYESKDACVINNQLCDYPTKSLSGAGIVYKFCCKLDEILNVSYANNYLDLVALGLVSDMVSLKDFETKHLVHLGLSNIRNPFFKQMKIKNSFQIGDSLTPFGIAFYITPYINATVRMGSKSEKQTLFESLLDFKAYQEIPSTKRGCKGQMETIVEQACRNCTNIKNRQTRARDASLERIEELIAQNNLLDNKILTILLSKDFDFENTLTGLIANQLMAKYQKPVLLLHERENTYEGSARGCNQSELDNFKEFLTNTNLIEYAEGHAQAFGAGLNKANIDEFMRVSNYELKDIDFNPSYKVDFIFNGDDFNSSDILKLAELKPLYGQGFEEPYIAIENLTISKDNITLMSKDKNPTLKIKLNNGCSLIRFKSSEEEYEKLYSDLGCVKINVVGRCERNIWNGMTTAQVIISDYEIIGNKSYYF